ncbi:uncharacterized protein LOC127848058 isoform X2 [Dreissena polymorpha]|uniref:uncharacterized protein LOC127848058 isoform X2 n=1 Tax=Dreissena polymorpha TaxID=45954 RepID=UPI0022646786|nr:uncharacterized protein LOC127848058 isoform X2 [Dreissena polymorpha]
MYHLREFRVVRTGEQCCKVYHNSKARYIQKVGEMQHPKTGSSVTVQFSSSEEVLTSTMQGHPVVQGLGRCCITDDDLGNRKNINEQPGTESERATTASSEEHNESTSHEGHESRGMKRKESFTKKRLQGNTKLTEKNLEKDSKKKIGEKIA